METPGIILLHACCGPCATASIERLQEDGWKVDLFYSNSNISPDYEYRKRLEGLVKTAEYFGLNWFEDDYNHESWLHKIAGTENEREQGARCSLCFSYSLGRTSQCAAAGGYDGFTTTLTVSPHKNSSILYEIGNLNGNFIEYNFKKKNGYKRSVELSDAIGLYRQNYCGCEFSVR